MTTYHWHASDDGTEQAEVNRVSQNWSRMLKETLAIGSGPEGMVGVEKGRRWKSGGSSAPLIILFGANLHSHITLLLFILSTLFFFYGGYENVS